MKKITLVATMFLFFSVLNSNAQRTFEKFLNITKIYGAEQNPDGSYILCFDSAGPGVMKLDQCGTTVWSNNPTLRNSNEKIYDVAPSPIGGGYIAGGSSPDTSGAFTEEPFLMILDDNGAFVSGRILPGGTVSGNVSTVHATADSGFVAGVFMEQAAATNASRYSRYDMALGNSWDVMGSGSQVNSASTDENANNEYLYSSYNELGSTAPAIRQISSVGLVFNTFVIPDTFQGAVSFHMNAVVDHCPSGDNLVGATLSPNAASYDYPYIAKLDAALNLVWHKYLDFGQSVSVLSILSISDNGAMCMLNRSDTIIFLRLNSMGDSLWSKTYTGIGTVKANQLRHCSDGGFLLSGNTSNGTDNFGLVLKLDSMAMVLPPVCVQAGNSTTLCPGSNVTLTADSGYQYTWSTSETTQSIVVDTAGVYYVTVTDSLSGNSAQSENIVVDFYNTSIPTISQLVTLLVSSPAVSYQWLLNGDTIVGATNSDILPPSSGNYSVIVEDSNGCILTSAIFTYIIPGVSELNSIEVFKLRRVSNDYIEVSMLTTSFGKLSLIDLRGVVVKELDVNSNGERTLQIPVSNLATGIYSLTWSSEKVVQVERVLIGY